MNQSIFQVVGVKIGLTLEVHYSDARGRHVKASRDIDVGECLIDEKAATHMTFLKNSLTHCYTCLRHVVSPLPCTTCSAVVFCGEKCRECQSVELYSSRRFWSFFNKNLFIEWSKV